MLELLSFFVFVCVDSQTLTACEDELKKTLDLYVQKFEELKNIPLPTAESLIFLERDLGSVIPKPLYDYYLKCGNIRLLGYEIERSHNLKDFYDKAKAEGLNLELYFPFCQSDAGFYCVQKESKEIFYASYWGSFEYEFISPSFNDWLRTII